MEIVPVQSKPEVLEKISWYAMRWKIETFHKILKSGCKVEEAVNIPFLGQFISRQKLKFPRWYSHLSPLSIAT